MNRLTFSLSAALVAVSLPVASALAGDAKTIRIEPRGYYGATITLEAGVRVFRPLPRTSHVVVNPSNAPVSISIEDVTKNVNANHRHAHERAAAQPDHHASVDRGFVPAHGKFRRRFRHHRKGRRNPSRRPRLDF